MKTKNKKVFKKKFGNFISQAHQIGSIWKSIPQILTAFILSFSGQSLFAKTQQKGDPSTLIFSFQKQKNPEDLKKSADLVKEVLEKELAQKVEVLVPSSYGATAQGLISNKVHVAFMDSLPYILASKETELDIIAVEKRSERTSYDSIFIVKKESNVSSLNDLKGRRMAFSSQTSTSGYLFPFKRILDEKLISSPKDLPQFFSSILFAGGYDKAMLAVLNGQADVAAVSDYAFEGEKASLYLTPEQRSQLKVLDRTPGVPTHLVAVNKKVSLDLRNKIQEALLKLSKKQPEIIASVYGASELVKPQSNHVEKTERALQQTNMSATDFVK